MQVKAQADSTDSTQAQESAKSELQSLKAFPTIRLPLHEDMKISSLTHA